MTRAKWQKILCALSCKSYYVFWNIWEKKISLPFSVFVRSCITPPHSPLLNRLAGTVMSLTAGKDERFCSVNHAGEQCDTLALPFSPATMRFPHTRHRIWVSAFPPRLSPFILNADKERERDWERVGGCEETEAEGVKKKSGESH